MRKNPILFACILFPLFLLTLKPINQNLILRNKITDSITVQNYNEYGNSIDMPLETVISRRMSIRHYDLNVAVPWELVSKVLWAAQGYSWRGRTVPSFSGYPVIIYVSNETATYKFMPEKSLTLWKEGDYRGLGGGYDAPTQLYIVLDTNICPDILWGNAESGCMIQNIYLMANALNLGTVCQYRRTDIHQGLGLPANEMVLYKMPLGYPLPPYTNYQNLVPTDRPSSPELPEIQDSNVAFEDALNSVFSSHEWSDNPVTCQELSQILWASYGYSYYEDTAASPPKRHRTVPSAHAYYPMKVYAANSSGVYEYLPEQHTLTTIVTEDRRPSIAQASGNAWASSAPLIIAVAYVENSRPWIGGEETYVEVGLIAQNVYLESAAWGLIADWGKADIDEEAMREALGLIGETHLHPASIITVGHSDITPPIISILSPENKTYTANDVPLTFTVSEATSWIGYSLDGQMNVTISGNTTIVGSSDGIHTITVYANGTAGNMGYSETVYFTVDTVSPSIDILSPENKTYTTSSVPLSFTVNESTSWIGFSLDGQTNVTITENTTLTGLLDGVHYVVVCANDTAGNMGASSTVYFTVDKTPPNITEVSQNPPKNNVRPEDEVKINAAVTDDLSGVKQATLNYTNGNGTWITVEMTNLEGNIWNATTPAFPYCTDVTYMVIAADNVNNIITTEEMGYEYQYHVIPEFRIFLILPLFMIATLLTLMIYKSARVTCEHAK